MRKKVSVLWVVCFLIAGMCGTAAAWQGRMAGMGDPYGLVGDDSDYLIHPALIANGQGVQYFSNYRFTYGDVTDWNQGARTGAPWFHASGDDFRNDALLGVALPAGPGRLGMFFTYNGKRGDFDGREERSPQTMLFDLGSDADNFGLKFLYGLPLAGSFKLGAELQVAYRSEDNSISQFYTNLPTGSSDFFGFVNNYGSAMLPYLIPFDSDYWDLQLKTGIEGNVGPALLSATVRGGAVIASDNTWQYHGVSSLTSQGQTSYNRTSSRMDGGVDGWTIGGDAWLRYPVSETLTLPFLFRVDYWDKNRHGSGYERQDSYLSDSQTTSIYADHYSNGESALRIETGGGVDYLLGNGVRLAGGMYYAYNKSKTDLMLNWVPEIGTSLGDLYDYTGYPDSEEHQILWKLAAEKQMSPSATLRAGFNAFLGWVNEDYSARYDYIPSDPATIEHRRSSLDGLHWGILGSVGGSVLISGVKVEPFVQGGYQELSVNEGSGDNHSVYPTGDQETRREAIIGTGISVWF